MKILVAYYSKSGGTKKIAAAIKAELESQGHSIDLEEIFSEKEHGFLGWWHIRMFSSRCKIKPPRIRDLSKYDAICIGSPNWTKLALPVAEYLEEVSGLKNKAIGFFSSTGAPPNMEWYLFSGYLLDSSLTKIIEKKKAKVVSSLLLSGNIKIWSSDSDYGKKNIKKFCEKISAPEIFLAKYTLKQKEIEESRVVIVFLLVINLIFIFSQIISSFFGRQILSWPQFFIFLAISFLAYIIIVTILGSKKALFLGKYIIISAISLILTLALLFLGKNIGIRITLSYLFLFMFTFFFQNFNAVIFAGVWAILSYVFILKSGYMITDLSPFFDIPIIILGIFVTGLIVYNMRKSFLKLLEAQDEADESRMSLEIKIAARTRELKELADGLEEKIKLRTNELQSKIDELERFNKLTVGREIRMIELKKQIKELEEKLKASKN